LHTGELESFHSLILEYASKETQFSYQGMILRHILAVLDHNYNVGRAKTGTKIVYSPARKEYVEKAVFAPKDDSWKYAILQIILKFSSTNPEIIEFNPAVEELLFPFHLPKNITGLEKPTTKDFLERRDQRNFSK